MLEQDTLNRVLDIYNEVVPEHRLTLDDLRLHVRLGTIALPEVLDDAYQLLKTLFRYGYEQRAAKFPVAPPAWEQQHRGLRWTIEEWPLALSVCLAGGRVAAGNPFTETTLVAIQQPEVVEYTGRDIFNDFLALDLPGLPTYPAPKDRDKILTFLARYGPNFLAYPRPAHVTEDHLD